jgi:hypothetical protein
LWDHLLSAFEIETSLPLSTRVANAKSADLAHYAARTLSDLLKPEEETGSLLLPGEAWKRLTALFSKGNPDFSAIVIAQNSLAKAGLLRPTFATSEFRFLPLDDFQTPSSWRATMGQDADFGAHTSRQRRPPTRSNWEALDSEGDLVSLSMRPDCWV